MTLREHPALPLLYRKGGLSFQLLRLLRLTRQEYAVMALVDVLLQLGPALRLSYIGVLADKRAFLVQLQARSCTAVRFTRCELLTETERLFVRCSQEDRVLLADLAEAYKHGVT